MRQLTEHAFGKLARAGTTKLERALGGFAKVFIGDGSLIRLSDALEADYPSVWASHTKASAKLHAVIDAVTRTLEILRIVPGSQHDLRLLSVDARARGTLFLFDLDVEVGCVFRNAPERDWRKRHLSLRLIAVWNETTKAHRRYLTTASRETLRTNDAAAIYALRWEIELLFRELKTQLRMEESSTGSKAKAEILIYASLLALAMSRKLLATFRTRVAGRVLPAERWSALLRAAMSTMLDLLVGLPALRSLLERRLLVLLAREAPDPNRKRVLLFERAQAGTVRAAAAA